MMNIQNNTLYLNKNQTFTSKKPEKTQEVKPLNGRSEKYATPVSSGMEYLTAVKATLLAGLVFTGKVVLELLENADSLDFGNPFKSKKQLKPGELINKKPAISPGLKLFGAAFGFVAISTVLFTVFNLPKNLNKTRIETYKKKKEMDVYVRSNSAEKNLSERIDHEGQVASQQKKAELSRDLMTLEMSKNEVPYFVNKKILPAKEQAARS